MFSFIIYNDYEIRLIRFDSFWYNCLILMIFWKEGGLGELVFEYIEFDLIN